MSRITAGMRCGARINWCRDLLAEAGYRVFEASGAAEVLCMAQGHVELVLIDVVMLR